MMEILFLPNWLIFGLTHYDQSESKPLSQVPSIFENKTIGTPNYQSPELILENKYHWYTDMFALAVVLWELLTHRSPERLQHVTKSTRQFIHDTEKAEHKEFYLLIESAWKHKPANERITAKLLQVELENLQETKYRNRSVEEEV
jgi:serine/threonine protein kinase